MSQMGKSLDSIDWKAVRERMAAASRATEEALKLSPERAQQILDERARTLAAVLSDDLPLGEILEVVKFELGHEHYAIEACYVREVFRLRTFTAVPGTPDFVLGICNLRGQLLPIFDLRKFFKLVVNGVTDLSRVVIIGESQAEFGILADNVAQVMELPVEAIGKARASSIGVERSYLRGVTDDALIVLDGAALLKEPALFLNSSHKNHEELL